MTKDKQENKPDPLMEKEYDVIQIGWPGENALSPVVLLDKKERTALNVKPDDYVKIIRKLGSVEIQMVGIVQVQFNDFINKQVASVNRIVADKLELDTVNGHNNKILVRKGLTESEVEKFKLECYERGRERFMGRLGY